MNTIVVSFFLFFVYFSLFAENRYFKIGFIDLENDIRYTDWGRHPVDIRSKHRLSLIHISEPTRPY